MTKVIEVFTIVWEDGKIKEFTDREEAKKFFEENKWEQRITLRKTITKIQEYTYNGNGVWL